MIIKQIYIEDGLKNGFAKNIINNLPLNLYNNINEPTFIYGCFSDKTMDILLQNTSIKIIIWVGGDININHPFKEKQNIILKYIDKIKQYKNIYHIAISSFIMNDLNQLNILYKHIPIMGINLNKYNPVVKGNCIYIYTDLNAEYYYGSDIYNILFEKFKNIKFIKLTHPNNKHMLQNFPDWATIENEDQLINMYSQCFIGLRLTIHDGLSATVQELGCMGIKCIHNGSSPSVINYKNIDDIERIIKDEMKTIGTIDTELSNRVKQYLQYKDDWFNTDFYISDN